ncbi:hypothetical protein NMD14_00675 [Aeromonas veronii]
MNRLMISAVVVVMISACSTVQATQPTPQGALEYDEIQGWVTVDPQVPVERVSVQGLDDPEMND